MRIGLSTTPIEPALAGNPTGIATYTAALAAHLPREGVAVRPYALPPTRRRPGLARSAYLPHSYLVHAASEYLGCQPAAAVDADVFHFTDHRVVRTRCPSVATVHDAIPLQFPHWASARLRLLKNVVMKRMIRRADLFVSVSHFARAELEEFFGLPPDRVRTVHCGIADEWLQPLLGGENVLSSRGLRPRGYFLFVGGLQPRKNVDRLVQAHRSLPEHLRREFPLVVVGRMGWRCEDTAATLSRAQATGEPLIWLDDVEDFATLRHLYRGAAALTFPSLYEGFGLPVLEAFASETPVITSNASSLPEVAGEAALLVDPFSVDEIAGAMLRIVDDPALAEQLRVQGRQRVAQFSWRRTAAALLPIYREVTARPV
ncbi:Capsular glucan synthase [Pigmentiphaga humi]|uniref:Capsular glucan synthase n=2 Tax=Pigmentiphaga humi TaxID=2478468 RepID=A0A3P4B2T6_9BURK|nr:Capsular glucan synthase [Pigmentiphaga humi]